MKNNTYEKGIGITLLIATMVFTILTILLIGVLGQFVDSVESEFIIIANHPTRREVAVNTLMRTDDTLQNIIYDVSTPIEYKKNKGGWTLGETRTFEEEEEIELEQGIYTVELEGEDGEDGESPLGEGGGGEGGSGGYIKGTIEVERGDKFKITFPEGEDGEDESWINGGKGGDGGDAVRIEHNNNFLAEAGGGGGGGGGAGEVAISPEGGDGGKGGGKERTGGDGGKGGQDTREDGEDGSDGSSEGNFNSELTEDEKGGARKASITFGDEIIETGSINETIERIFPEEDIGLQVRDEDGDLMTSYGENINEIEDKYMTAPRTIPLPEGNKATVWLIVEDPFAGI